jgi:hypothetical protein
VRCARQRRIHIRADNQEIKIGWILLETDISGNRSMMGRSPFDLPFGIFYQ